MIEYIISAKTSGGNEYNYLSESRFRKNLSFVNDPRKAKRFSTIINATRWWKTNKKRLKKLDLNQIDTDFITVRKIIYKTEAYLPLKNSDNKLKPNNHVSSIYHDYLG